MTIADLRTLLTLARGPAVERLEDRTPEGVARAHLPRFLTVRDGSRCLSYHAEHALMRWSGTELIDLTDPGTVNTVKVALALALGLDPGAMGCAVSWVTSGWPDHGNRWWHLTGVRDHRSLRSSEQCRRAGVMSDPRWDIDAPEVAAEPDPIKALVLACQHVIREKA